MEQNRHLLGLLHDKNMCEGKALVSVGDHDINMGQQSEVAAQEVSFTLRLYQLEYELPIEGHCLPAPALARLPWNVAWGAHYTSGGNLPTLNVHRI